jgi:hypothetical protein
MENISHPASIQERRLKPRMKCNYPAVVQGQVNGGKKFREEGRVINLSRCGIYMVLNQVIPDGKEVSIRIALPTGMLEFGSSKLATSGTVVRSESRLDGTFGVAIKFQNYRIL